MTITAELPEDPYPAEIFFPEWLPKEEQELRVRLGEQIYENIQYWLERLRVGEDYVHATVAGEETGEISEGWFYVWPVSHIQPRSTRFYLQFFLLENGVTVDSTPIGGDSAEGSVETDGNTTIMLGKIAALTDPERAEYKLKPHSAFPPRKEGPRPTPGQ